MSIVAFNPPRGPQLARGLMTGGPAQIGVGAIDSGQTPSMNIPGGQTPNMVSRPLTQPPQVATSGAPPMQGAPPMVPSPQIPPQMMGNPMMQRPMMPMMRGNSMGFAPRGLFGLR